MKIKYPWDVEEEEYSEIEFQKAYKEMATEMGLSLDPDDPEHYYDYRALYKEKGNLKPDETGHFPSKFKLEGHPKMVIEGVDTKTGKSIISFPWDKTTAQVGIGAKAKMGVTLPKPIPLETLETPGIIQRMRDIGEVPKKYPIEGVTIELKEAQNKLNSLWWSELQTTEDKWKFLKQENWSPELQEADLKAMRLSEQASEMGVNTGDWIEYGVYMTFFASMAASILPILRGMPTEVLNKIKYKVGDKTVKGKELFNTIKRVAYSDSPAYPDPSKLDKEVFAKFIEKGGVKGIGGLAKGITIPTIEPRFAFGTKLYAGLPIDEMVKSIVKAGKITQEIANGLKVMKPADVGIVFQQLITYSPVIASKVASEIVEFIPQKITIIPKEKEIMTPKELEELEKLREVKVVPEEEVEPTKAELKAIEKPITKEKFEAKWEELKAKVKEPVVPEEKIVPELKKVIEIREETEKTRIKLINIRVEELKEEGFKGVDKGELKRDEEGKVIGHFPAVSRNPKWYRDFYKEHKARPKLLDLKEIAKDQLLHGHEEDYGIIPPSKIYQKIDAQIESYDTIIDTLKVEVKELVKPAPEPKVKREVKKVTEEEKEFLKAEIKYPEKFAKEEIKEYKKFISEEEKDFLKAEAEYPAKIVKEEVEDLKPLATSPQIKKAHVIAKDKALISDKGKMKPQYRELAITFTDHKSIKDMTKEEAEVFIDVLERLPEPKYRAGKLVPPSIPRTMKLIPEGFFRKEYGEPTPIWLLTDQTYYATKLGIKPLVAPFEKGKQEFDLEFRLSSKLVDKMIDKLNKIAGTSAFAKIKSKIKNVPTKVESEMAELINKHEATPPGLKPKEEDVFKYFRNLGKDIWRRENEVREKVDLPPIKYKQAYFRHTADAMAKEMMEGKYPFPQGIKYWGEKMVGKKIFNPMEFHRKLSDDLIDIWSKDIRAVTKAMLWNGLKEIYLAQPAKFLNEQLNAISKDLPEYKNLSQRDQAAYDQTRVIPASTKKWLINYVNQVLKGQEPELDASLNRIVTNSGLNGIFNKVLSPFGRSLGKRPITHLFMLSGRAVISGVMGWVPRQIMRNSFQPVQNLALYGIKATIKAYLPASVDKNLKELMSESLFLKSYTGFEELPTNLMGKLEKIWLGPYGIVAVNNAKLGMKAAYWNIIELIRNPKFKEYGWADPQRTKDTPKGFLYPSEKEKLLKEMEFGASATQYQYIPLGMPGVFRYKALVPLTRLQSWWMNYFTKFLREAIYRGFKGRPSWSDEDRPTLPWSRRVNFLKYVIIGGAILTSLGYRRSFLLGVLPVYMSPAAQVALGMYNYATATEDWKRKKALKQVYYSWKAFIPGSLAWRDFLAVWNGEKDLNEILWYAKKEEKPKGKPVPSVKYEWEKETKPKTEPKNIIKFDWD